jgi:hypothetical protein
VRKYGPFFKNVQSGTMLRDTIQHKTSAQQSCRSEEVSIPAIETLRVSLFFVTKLPTVDQFLCGDRICRLVKTPERQNETRTSNPSDAGTLIFACLVLGHQVNPNWLWFVAFFGVNLIQSIHGITFGSINSHNFTRNGSLLQWHMK